MDNVCNRCLFSIPSKVEMAQEQEYLEENLLGVYWLKATKELVKVKTWLKS